ncbi:hypothetical protein OB13_20045 [Pontibacter sp. HJ8]
MPGKIYRQTGGGEARKSADEMNPGSRQWAPYAGLLKVGDRKNAAQKAGVYFLFYTLAAEYDRFGERFIKKRRENRLCDPLATIWLERCQILPKHILRER